MSIQSPSNDRTNHPWYAGVTRYQWIVLAIASAGWVFDVYEGQIFNITRNQMLAEILGGSSADVARYGDMFLGIFLLGGTVGGLAAGSLADRFGRQPLMIATILIYSVFSGLTYFATELWQVAALRFLVAVGVGGEWAVAASLVAEVFPARARAQASGIFHASSVLGTWMAALAGIAVGGKLAVCVSVRHRAGSARGFGFARSSANRKNGRPRRSSPAASPAQSRWGSFRELLTSAQWGRRALLGMLLASVGLGTFWAVVVAGQGLTSELLTKGGMADDEASQYAKFAYGIVQTAGGGVGLLAFGPLSARFGRRKTFTVFQILAFLIVPLTCWLPQTYTQLLCILPVFGFLTLGIHAGYAIYFPELFPTHLRATGHQLLLQWRAHPGRARVVFFQAGSSRSRTWTLKVAVTSLAALFLMGAAVVLFLPETRASELPE